MVREHREKESSRMQCSRCGRPGTTFTRARHPRHGVVYLCDACRAREQPHLRPADSHCACDPDSVLHH